jgi:hypothetical protein
MMRTSIFSIGKFGTILTVTSSLQLANPLKPIVSIDPGSLGEVTLVPEYAASHILSTYLPIETKESFKHRKSINGLIYFAIALTVVTPDMTKAYSLKKLSYEQYDVIRSLIRWRQDDCSSFGLRRAASDSIKIFPI